jgi:hypothetical protein
VASAGFALFGSPLSAVPFKRFEEEVTAEFDQLEADGLVQANAFPPDALTHLARDASTLASLPQTAFLTGLGIWLAFDGRWPAIVAVLMIAAAMWAQRLFDMHRRLEFGGLQLPVTTVAVLGANVIGLGFALVRG